MSESSTGPGRDDALAFDGLAPSVPSGIERLSDVRVPSGMLAVCDQAAWASADSRRLFEVPAGRHRVDLCRVDEGPALLRVLLHPSRAARWEPALGTDGQGRARGVVMESGVLTLVDATDARALAERWRPGAPHVVADGRAIDEALAAQGGDWGEWWFVPGRRERLLLVRSEDGARSCPAFWGLDAEGRRVALVFDFLLGRPVAQAT
ncbi:MAG: DUF4241 domain-containing protein [Myxococcaceae bacterium]|nr:DUF4241 domain-containing protein [Myxococcaceae bacterium]MCI0669431.1 DUF4241 domain-containing protein [Myxococcaceae bacterium]